MIIIWRSCHGHNILRFWKGTFPCCRLLFYTKNICVALLFGLQIIVKFCLKNNSVNPNKSPHWGYEIRTSRKMLYGGERDLNNIINSWKLHKIVWIVHFGLCATNLNHELKMANCALNLRAIFYNIQHFWCSKIFWKVFLMKHTRQVTFLLSIKVQEMNQSII